MVSLSTFQKIMQGMGNSNNMTCSQTVKTLSLFLQYFLSSSDISNNIAPSGRVFTHAIRHVIDGCSNPLSK